MSETTSLEIDSQSHMNFDFYLEQAKVYGGQHKWKDMMNASQSALEIQRENVDAKLLLSEALLNQEEWQQVIGLCEDILSADPHRAIAYHWSALSLLKLEQVEQADGYYSKLFEIYPDFDEHYSDDFLVQRQSGDFFFRRKEWGKAIASYQRAIDLNALSCWEYINLGRVFSKVFRLSEAVEVLEKAVEVNPNNGFAHYYLAEFLFDSGNLEAAIKSCRQAIHLMPSHIDSRNLAQEINSKQAHNQSNASSNNSSAEMKTDIEKATDVLLDPLPGWEEDYRLGKDFQIKGDLQPAINSYHQAIIKNPSYSWAYHDLGDTFLKLGSWYEAIAAYRQAIKLNPDYFWSNYNLGVAYRNVKDWNSAVQLYKRSIALNPSLGLPVKALEETLRDWYDSISNEGKELLRLNKEKSLELFKEAIYLYQQHIHVPTFDIPRVLHKNIRVLLVVDDHLNQCLRYRVKQKMEHLEHAGFFCEYYSWTDVKQAKNKIAFFDVIFFYRVPAFPDIINTIQYAKSIKKVIFYEIDDLIFDSDLFPDPIESYGGQITEEQYDGLVHGTILFQEAMRLCDLGIASTPALLKQIEKVIGDGNCYLHRNALDSNNLQSLSTNTPKVERDYISIFYGSGTKAHNSDFDELVAPALAQILQLNSNVRLTLMGYLTLPSILEPFQDRIDRIDIAKDILVYYEFLKQADISMAVLHPTIVNNCKSELKWFEAATFKVPCVVSNTEVYLDVVNQGQDGFIASNPDEWFQHLDTLVRDEELRKRMGESAHQRVMKEYSIPMMADNIKRIISQGIERNREQGNIVAPSTRKKLLVVNVFYPPQSIGGATRIVKDNVDILTSQYRDEYDVSVFTTEEGNQEPYQLFEYSYEGVHVTRVSSPMQEGMDWQYNNPKMYDIFKEYLEIYQPDLIHFHCIQRLTASVLEAAADMNIPYLVTAHDAWWISDHQFLVNADGVECDYQQNDPVIAAADTHNITESMQRKLYLREQLNRASTVLAVSETFARIYQQNGFPQTKTNRNGIQPRPVLPRKPSSSGRVRLAHIGGMAAHKGYFWFKESVEQANLSNLEVIVINHAQSSGTIEHGDWNGTPVTFLAKFKQDEIQDLYSMIDVLVAPSMWPESFGLVTREAAASGVWVITSNKGAIGEDVEPGKTGHICSVEDPDSLIRILQGIDEETERYKQMLENLTTVRTTSQQVSEMLGFYETVLR